MELDLGHLNIFLFARYMLYDLELVVPHAGLSLCLICQMIIAVVLCCVFNLQALWNEDCHFQSV